MKSGRSGALKLGKFGLSCKAHKCNDAGTRDLGVLLTHETTPINTTSLRRRHQATASPGGEKSLRQSGVIVACSNLKVFF